MGREVKRIALDFNWPLNVIWKGYICPYRSTECKACDSSGQNPATKKLADDWYAFDKPGRHQGWCYHLEQTEVDALVEKGRLMDLTHTWKQGEGWKRREDGHHPTAQEVNEWAKTTPLAHDSINRWICVESRAKRLGVFGDCSLCNGLGYYWCDDKYEKLQEEWERIEPPSGDGYQIWETVSEGSPISPVFSMPEELAKWCAEQTDGWYKRNSSYEQWLKFIGVGWAPSLIVSNGEVKDGVEAV